METTNNVLNTRAAFPLEMYIRVKFKIPTSSRVELVIGSTYFREMDAMFSTDVDYRDEEENYLYASSAHLHTFLKEVELRPAANYACHETAAEVLNAKLQDEIEKIRFRLVDTITVIDLGEFELQLTLCGVPDAPETDKLIEKLSSLPEEQDVELDHDERVHVMTQLLNDNYAFYQGSLSDRLNLVLKHDEETMLSSTLLKIFSEEYFEVTQVGNFDVDAFTFKSKFHDEQETAFMNYIAHVKENGLTPFVFTGTIAKHSFR